MKLCLRHLKKQKKLETESVSCTNALIHLENFETISPEYTSVIDCLRILYCNL